MDVHACAVGRIGPAGPWLGFAPTVNDGYALVIEGQGGLRQATGEADLMVAMSIAYFEDALDPPPDELAATHADIASLVRHLAEREADGTRQRQLRDAVDAIDDGLAADAVIACLATAMRSPAATDPVGWLIERARDIAADD